MLELTSTKQWKDEPVVDYINRWRNLSLDCNDRLSELFQKRSNPRAKQHLKSRSGKPCPRGKKEKPCRLQTRTMMSLLNLQQPKGVGRPQMDQTHPFSDTSRCQEERMVNPRSKLKQAKLMHSGTGIM
ncbi:hypothetical protein FF1_000535 [Malus domestica]